MKIRYIGDMGGGVVLENGQHLPHGEYRPVDDAIAEKLIKERPKDFETEEKKKKGGDR